MTVTLEGREEDNKYGHQYKIQAVLSSETDPCTGIRKFLSDGYILDKAMINGDCYLSVDEGRILMFAGFFI